MESQIFFREGGWGWGRSVDINTNANANANFLDSA